MNFPPLSGIAHITRTWAWVCTVQIASALHRLWNNASFGLITKTATQQCELSAWALGDPKMRAREKAVRCGTQPGFSTKPEGYCRNSLERNNSYTFKCFCDDCSSSWAPRDSRTIGPRRKCHHRVQMNPRARTREQRAVR